MAPEIEEFSWEEKEVIFDRLACLIRMGEDDDFLSTMLEKFVELMPLEIEDIQTALNAGDMKMVAYHAHKLKGMSANISALRIFKVAGSIEVAAAGDEIDRLRRFLKQLLQERNAFLSYISHFS